MFDRQIESPPLFVFISSMEELMRPSLTQHEVRLYAKGIYPIKNDLCKLNNITLIRIPYTEKNNLEVFIKKELTLRGVL